ncbi:hypothetical protein VCHA51O444_10537 [Vibrio chagasii]|nr:hypothetical protein VCHA51O444_10537 [Vibrio chagasii]CAH7352306.1 hypothetical protein VCHA53O474_30345 [Vibrio chagasii]
MQIALADDVVIAINPQAAVLFDLNNSKSSVQEIFRKNRVV